jgi:hypothetical protein
VNSRARTHEETPDPGPDVPLDVLLKPFEINSPFAVKRGCKRKIQAGKWEFCHVFSRLEAK